MNWTTITPFFTRLKGAFCVFFTVASVLSAQAQNRILDSLLTLLPDSKDTARVEVLYRIAQQYGRQKNAALLDSFVTRAIEEGLSKGYWREVSIAYSVKGEFLSNQGLNEESLKEDLLALSYSEKAGDKRRIAFNCNSIGIALWNLTRYTEAIHYLKRSIALYDELNDYKGKARPINNLGLVYWNKGDYAEALDIFMKSYRIEDSLGNRIGSAYSLGNIGNVYRTQERFEEALPYYQKANQIFRELNDSLRIAISLHNIGNIYLSLNQLDLALDTLRLSLLIAEQFNHKNFIRDALEAIGAVYEEKEDFARSLTYYQRAKEMSEALGNTRAQTTTLQKIGSVYLKQKRYSEALNTLTQSLNLGIARGNKASTVKTYELLTSAYQGLNNYPKALEASLLRAAYRDSIINEKTENRIAELKAVYQLNEKEKEITLLEKENELQRQSALTDRITFASALAFLFILLTATAIGYKIKQYANLKLEEKTLVISAQKQSLETQTKLLQSQKEELMKANELKNELLAIAAHDLKNPIQTIMGFAQLIQDSRYTRDEILQMAKRIEVGSGQMVKLIDDLLEMSAIESGRLELHFEPVEMNALILECMDAFLLTAQKKEQAIHFSPLAPVWAHADRNRMKEVIDNLISNALKYSPRNTVVTIELQTHIATHAADKGKNDQTILIRIIDQGLGMTPNDLEKLFGKFQRLSARPTGGESSTGLGLSIVKQIVELHNGRVWAESKGKHHGTMFYITLPIKAPEGVALNSSVTA